MLVYKFGGTSVGSVVNINHVKDIIDNNDRKIVVLSAMSGTTNALVDISEFIKSNHTEAAIARINTLNENYNTAVYDLLHDKTLRQEVSDYVNRIFKNLVEATQKEYSTQLYNSILANGELLSTYMFSRFLQQEGFNVALLPALDFMRIDRNNEPDNFYIKQNITRLINSQPVADIYITQGFISLDADGYITNLQRGGSDYTATIIGAAIEADEVQIWTDIDGFHNNDPRFVNDTKALSHLSYDEAAELAYFGAKILHPQTVMPVRSLDIPLRLKNTMAPDAHGTLITNQIHGDGIKAIAAKDGITAIKIKSVRMLLAHGFLKKVFEIFETYETAIDMITTSEIAVSLTIDDTTNLDAIVTKLQKFAQVEVEDYMSIACLVGNNIIYHPDTPELFQVLQDVNVRMIAYGGSNNNISLLVNTSDKLETLQKLQRYVFNGYSVLA
ncbi:aspartate kinase [Winogradskyella sp. PC-19]|uniref:aspartate kinase n=1 Tax=unclassified Winogradskyella TaxID=2615021 RepID=UPI000B3C354A|nr:MULTISPECIES: aspartate kinase [unclassified Winogradskyella]ARV09841.1 aspartate kinase [Winogradskyella sp. PC-19]RZN83283.1 MAG: aspartate kinase [Winogradskyella sp.]